MGGAAHTWMRMRLACILLLIMPVVQYNKLEKMRYCGRLQEKKRAGKRRRRRRHEKNGQEGGAAGAAGEEKTGSCEQMGVAHNAQVRQTIDTRHMGFSYLIICATKMENPGFHAVMILFGALQAPP
eukprot:gene10629-biopygen16802